MIQPFSDLSGDISLGYISQLVYDLVDQLIQTNLLPDYWLNIPEQGMILIGPEDLFVLIHLGDKQPCLFEAIQLQPDGIRRFVELCFKPT